MTKPAKNVGHKRVGVIAENATRKPAISGKTIFLATDDAGRIQGLYFGLAGWNMCAFETGSSGGGHFESSTVAGRSLSSTS